MTAGVAHEINNPVNFISGGVIGLKRVLKAYVESPKDQSTNELEKDMNDMIAAIAEGAKRSSDIVKSLQLFSREDTEFYLEADIVAGLESTLKLLSNKLKDGIFLEKDFEEKPILIFCFPGQLNQVFMNIISNAIYAMKEEGEIEITVSELDDEVLVGIKDSGDGISEEAMPNIFNPFFTTKDVGEGTGLGLSIVYGIIERHQGRVWADSK